MSFTKIGHVFKAALAVNNRAFPWERAIGAALAMSLPIFIGIWLAQLKLGLLAGLGGFTYLYAFRLPYAHLSKRLLFVGVSIVLCAFLGSILAPYPMAVTIMLGLIAAIMIFIFNALKFIGPSAIFFVMIFALTADMPQTDIMGALLRAGLVALGALLSWLIAMSGFLINPHRPELLATKRSLAQLIRFTRSIGTAQFQHEKYLTMSSLKETIDTLMAGELPWSPSETYQRLLHLTLEINELFLYLIENYSDETAPQQAALADFLTKIEQQIKKGLKSQHWPEPPALDDSKLNSYVQNILKILKEPVSELPKITLERKESIKDILINAFDRNSLVFLTAIRFGVISALATFIAHSFDFTRSYWIPLSCVAVMSGASMIATFHRALQRSLGTILGILIASCILYFSPSSYVIALCILIFTALTELFIVKNYGLAVIFITPNALLLAETITGGEFSFFHFSSARMIDVFIGSAIGLIGVVLMSQRTASVRIPRIMMRTLRNQSQMLLLLFSTPKPSTDSQIKSRLIKMHTNMSNLTALYNAAIGEVPQKRALIEYYWPIIYSMEKLAFLLEHAAETDDRPVLSDEALASLLFIFETLANSAKYFDKEEIKNVPKIPQFSTITSEIETLQKAFIVTPKPM